MTRPDYEQAKKSLILDPTNPEPEGVRFDKPPPKTAPQPLVRQIPEHLLPIHQWIAGIVKDESMVLDLCLEEAVKILEFNHDKGLVGIDYFAGDGSGAVPTRLNMIAVSVPLAVELYKQALVAINARQGELDKILEEIQGKKNDGRTEGAPA